MSTKRWKLLGLAMVAAAIGLIHGGPAPAAERLVIGGTGGDLATMRRLGEAFATARPGVSVEVLPSLGSGGGIKAVLAGRIDLAISSRAVRGAETGQGAMSVPYARTALALVTSRSDAPGLTTADLVEIYTGAVTAWPDGKPIRLVLRPDTDSDTKIVGEALPGMKAALAAAAARPVIPVGASDQEAASLLESTTGSLGFISLPMVTAEGRVLTLLTLDGVLPGADTVADGRYPVPKTFHFVHRSDPPGPVAAFLRFVGSEEGQRILRELGHVPLLGSGA